LRAARTHELRDLRRDVSDNATEETGACEIEEFASYDAAFYLPSLGFTLWVSNYYDPRASQLPARIDVASPD
jgi:hypothetical protein